MKETLIKFETAILAKYKGFDIPTHLAITNKDTVLKSSYKTSNSEWDNVSDKRISNLTALTTQSLLQKWLREEHNIHIQIVVAPISGLVDYYFLIRFGENIGGIESSNDQLIHGNYESALEEALMQSLKLI